MEGFLRHDLNANRGRPGVAAAHGTTDNPDTPVSKAAALLLSQDLQPVFGPFLRFNNWDINTSLWTGSVLEVAHHTVTQRPFLTYTSATAGQQSSEGILLDTYGQHNFWRFSLAIPLGQQPQTFQYSIEYGQGTNFNPSPPARTYTVHLPSRDQPWHWAFHSCSGFSLSVHQPDWGGVAPLWRDLLQQHQASPLHLVVGGGDQLYNDTLFKLPTTKVWLAIKDAKQRDMAPFDPQMTQEVYEYYFRNYAVHFSAEAMSEAFATIPQTMTWDDHDIFDGWGSYPESLQNCPVFQGCFQAAKRFYLLFQQHTNQAGVSQLTDMFGHRGYSMLKQCGPKLALVIPDARLERTKAQVIDPETWEMVFSRMRALPQSTRHVVMVTTVPVVYPQIPGSEMILETVSGADRGNKFANILKKTGLTKAAMSSFGEPELLDDLVDHWNAGNHKEERRMLVEKCQEISAAHCLRISFLSGDVHVCGAGRMYSDPKVNLANDHRYMPQIVSSAIVNAPPPEGVIKTLHLCSQAHKNVDKSTKEKMLRLFKNEKDLGDKLAGRRNWCEIWEANQSIPARNQSLPEYQLAAQGSLVFTLRLEMDKNHPGVSMKPIDIPIVPLMTQSGSFATNAPTMSPTSSSVGGLSQGMGSMSLNSSNPASQGYGQPNPQAAGGYPTPQQGAGNYSPLGQGQHGQLSQPGQNGAAGQGQYGQPNQAGQGYHNQGGQGQYGQPNQAGAGQYDSAGQGQYGQPQQAGQSQYGQPNQAGQGQYGQPQQAGQGQYGQPNQAGQQGQSTGGFQTYPEMSSNTQPFSGNNPYNGNANGNGINQYPGSPSMHQQQQQQPFSGQQGNNGSYAPYPDLGNGNNGAYGQGNAAQGYQNVPGSNYANSGSGNYGTYGQSNNYGGGVQSQGSNASQFGQGSAQQNQQYGQGNSYSGNQYSQGGQQGVNWPAAPQWNNNQAPQTQTSNGGAQYSQHPYGNIPPAL